MARRSSRPLTHTFERLSIKTLREWALLQVGCNNRKVLYDGTVIATNLAAKRTTCRILQGKNALILWLESRPLGRGLVWYFKDPASGALCTELFFTEGLVGNRKTVGAVYSSQYQDKTYQKLVRMGKLIVAIDGDPDRKLGPGRGSRKLKNVELLRQKVGEIVSNKEQLEETLDKHPVLSKIPQTAIAILRRELPRLPKEWDKFDRLHKMNPRWDDLFYALTYS